MTTSSRPKIALWFRYGPAEHTELFHAMPQIVRALAARAEVHYYGLRTSKPIPALILENAVIHELPFRVDRAYGRDKVWKTLLWVLCLPWIGLSCRFRGVAAVYIDETVPLTAGIARIFFGRAVAVTVADFFPEIYFGHSRLMRPVVKSIRFFDLAAWRRLPLIYTRAASTRTWLARQGVQAERVHPVYDPCDFAVYRPVDRAAARRRFGYTDDDFVLVHHGILHPNKGNDRILRALATVRPTLPSIRYLLVGDGSEMQRLRALAQELGISDIVQLTGWLPKMTDVNEALNAGDVGLVMRVGETFDDFHMTGALVHNMAVGLPILAARLGGVSEAIHEDDAGVLFDPDDMDQFATQLRRLAGDPAARARMGQRALALAKELFDIQKVTLATVAPLLKLAGVP